jgi:hypothetical protein
MSGLHDNLEAWALAHGTEVAAAVVDHEPVARAAIRARRRNRLLATGATAIVAAVGVVAMASAIPGVNQPPAAQDLSRHLSELVCGDPWVASSGTTDYIAVASSLYSAPSGEWTLTDDNGDTHVDFSGFTAGLGSVSWQGEVGLKGHVIVRERTVAVKLGTIVGVTEEQYAQIGEGGAKLDVNTPRPGACGDVSPGNSSGKVTYHLVLQLSRVGDQSGRVATIVDPGGAKTVDIDGVEAYVSGKVDESVRAFVVPTPTTPSCRPYQDLIAQGVPTYSARYATTIPGLRSGVAVVEPYYDDSDYLVINAESPLTDHWYANRNAWLVVESGWPKIAIPLGWNADHTRLVESSTAPRPESQADCVVTLEGVPPSGAVYLVIDGVDWDAVSEQNPLLDVASVSGFQTWVYLGQAD